MFFDPFKKRTTCNIVYHMHLSGHSVIYLFIFFQGKSKENLALIITQFTMGSNGDETVTMEDFTRIEKIGEGTSSCT